MALTEAEWERTPFTDAEMDRMFEQMDHDDSEDDLRAEVEYIDPSDGERKYRIFEDRFAAEMWIEHYKIRLAFIREQN